MLYKGNAIMLHYQDVLSMFSKHACFDLMLCTFNTSRLHK